MLAMYPRAAGRRGSDRRPLDVVDIRLLEDLAAFSGGEEPQQSDQIFPRVKLRLVVEPHGRPVEERRARDELGIEAQFGREVGFLL